jgi:hypothetical protein
MEKSGLVKEYPIPLNSSKTPYRSWNSLLNSFVASLKVNVPFAVMKQKILSWAPL